MNLAHYNLRACGSFRMFHERFRVDEFDIGEPAVNGGRQGGRTTASTAQPRTATEAAVESVASTFSAVVEGAPETQADANAFSDPLAPPNLVSDVVSKVLASVGLSGRATARDFGQGGPASAAEGTLTARCRTVDAVGCGRPARRRTRRLDDRCSDQTT